MFDFCLSFLEKAFTDDAAKGADEAFLTGTTTEIMPVVSISGKQIADGKVGPITRKIQKGYKDLIAKECGLA